LLSVVENYRTGCGLNMKSSKELIGRSIVTLNQGYEIGKVESLIINHHSGNVDYIKVQNEEWQFIERVVSFEKVIGLSHYAVTIETENDVHPIIDVPDAKRLIKTKVLLIGSKIIGRKGQYFGEIEDYYFNEEDGKIESFVVTISEEKVTVDTKHVLTYGSDFVVINEETLQASSEESDSEEHEIAVENVEEEESIPFITEAFEKVKEVSVLEETEEESKENSSLFKEKEKIQREERNEEVDQEIEINQQIEMDQEIQIDQEINEKPEIAEEEQQDEEVVEKEEFVEDTFEDNSLLEIEKSPQKKLKPIEQDVVNQNVIVEKDEQPIAQKEKKPIQQFDEFREKQIQILLGKKVLKDIKDEAGTFLIKKDTILDRETIIEAQDNGPAIVIDLAMNVREQ
jgi:uncharacterized protein YrrD